MSYIPSTRVQCETVQKMLNDHFLACMNPLEPMPALEAVLAYQGANSIAQEVYDGKGKVKTVKVVYEQRLLESAVTLKSTARTCTTATQTNDEYQTYSIDTGTYLEVSDGFKVSDLATVCTDDPNSLLIKKLNKLMDVIERKVATQSAVEMVGLAGNWSTLTPTGTAQGQVNTSDELILAQYISSATKQIDPFSMTDLDLAIKQAGYCGPVIVVGGSALYKYGQAVEKGCCSTIGVNVMEMANEYGKAIFYDQRIEAAMDTTGIKSLVFQGGSVAMLYYNEAPQIPAIGANYVKMIMDTPRLGIPVDVTINDTCGQISIIVRATTKIVGLPTDMFASGDIHEGQTFVNKVKIVNPA